MNTVTVSTLQPALTSVANACKYLGNISKAGFYQIIDEFETVRIGSRRLVVVASLDRYIEAKAAVNTVSRPGTGKPEAAA